MSHLVTTAAPLYLEKNFMMQKQCCCLAVEDRPGVQGFFRLWNRNWKLSHLPKLYMEETEYMEPRKQVEIRCPKLPLQSCGGCQSGAGRGAGPLPGVTPPGRTLKFLWRQPEPELCP